MISIQICSKGSQEFQSGFAPGSSQDFNLDTPRTLKISIWTPPELSGFQPGHPRGSQDFNLDLLLGALIISIWTPQGFSGFQSQAHCAQTHCHPQQDHRDTAPSHFSLVLPHPKSNLVTPQQVQSHPTRTEGSKLPNQNQKMQTGTKSRR